MSEKTWLVYGANGFTGELIVREACARGHRPILAGRDHDALSRLAGQHKLEYRIFSLEASSAIIKGLGGIDMVLHCAGPFSQTSKPMVDACFATRTHYFDITGEVEVFEAIKARGTVAQQYRIMLMPGVGFDVVPTDCLALNLKKLLPDANWLTLAFDAEGRPSRGTAKTIVEGIKLGGLVRRDGNLRKVPIAFDVRDIPFRHSTKRAVTIPWGDISTAYSTTGIPNIDVYKGVTRSELRQLKLSRYLRPWLAGKGMQRYLRKKIERMPAGPDAEQRQKSRCYIWGEVKNPAGECKHARMVTPNGYDVTAQAAVGIIEYFLKVPPSPGARTPASVLGEHYIRTLKGVELKISR